MKCQAAAMLLAYGLISDAAYAQMTCREYQLNVDRDFVTTKGPMFEVRNGGQGAVKLVTNENADLGVLEAGKQTMMFGDENYTYSIKLVDPKAGATVTLCE